MTLNHELALQDKPSANNSGATPGPHKGSKWRTAAVLLATVVAVTSIIAVVNHIGVRITGDVMAWRQWIRAHALHFFIWRLFVYGAAAAGWVWVSRRRLQRFPTGDMARPMLRAEIFLVSFIVIFEIHKWLLRG